MIKHLVTFASFTTYLILCFTLAAFLNSCEKPQTYVNIDDVEEIIEIEGAVYFSELDFSTGSAQVNTGEGVVYILNDLQTIVKGEYKNHSKRLIPQSTESFLRAQDSPDAYEWIAGYEFVDVMFMNAFDIGDDWLSYVEPRAITEQYIVF